MPAFTHTPAPSKRSSITPTDVVLPTLPPDLDSLVVAYTQDGIWVWKNGQTNFVANFSGEPPPPYMNFYQFDLSDDGAYLAFPNNDYEVWSIRTDGTQERLLMGYDVFNQSSIEDTTNGVLVRPCPFQWVPNSHTLQINTLAWIGTGLYGLFGDFYVVDGETGQVKFSGSEQTGHYYVPSPNGKQFAVVDTKQVDVMNLDGSERRSIFSIPQDAFITMSSNSPRLPDLMWGQDNQSFVVTMAKNVSPESLYGEAQVIQVFTNARSQQLAEFPWHVADTLNSVSPDFEYILYTKPLRRGNMVEVSLVNTFVEEDAIIYTGSVYDLLWAPDSTHFLIVSGETQNNILLGNVSGEITPFLTDGRQALAAEWITAESILLICKDSIRVGLLGYRESIPLVSLQDWNPVFDVYDFAH